ncbi:MAG: hypothetical protein ACOH13_00555 [Flavobacteriales bacterium]
MAKKMNILCSIPYKLNLMLFMISVVMIGSGLLLEMNGLSLLGGIMAFFTLIPPALAAQIRLNNENIIIDRYVLFYLKKSILNLNLSKIIHVDLSEAQIESSIKISPIRILTDALFKSNSRAKEFILIVTAIDESNMSLRLKLKFSDENHLLRLQQELRRFMPAP